jgi:cellulose synthase/poly-beta-1,6-N-acetylglucosamine synthase-like glycosyltransferase
MKRKADHHGHSFTFLSVIIPVFNERENLPALFRRLERMFSHLPYGTECIVVDDRSTDGSAEFLRQRAWPFTVRILEKKGKQGKLQSLREGIAAAEGGIIAMIDADLQYPPEEIPALVKAIGTYDIVVARRTHRRTSFLRSFFSNAFNVVCGRLLLSLNVDVQSGLKVFRKDALKGVAFSSSAWGFDYQFLFQSQRFGWTIGERPIIFEERFRGTSNVRVFRDGFALAWGALRLRLRTSFFDVFPFLAAHHPSEFFPGGFDNTTDFLFLPEIFSVKKQLRWETVSLAAVCMAAAAGILALGSILLSTNPLILVSGIISSFYLGLILFKLWVLRHAMSHPPLRVSGDDVRDLNDEDLPHYTILIPLYKEADVVPQILQAMTAIDYPPDKLDIMITLEEYDEETRTAIERAGFPPHFRIVTLPDVAPKTKPKALNVAFREAKGEYIVIYDAEIIPDPDQLKKAVIAFRTHADVACLQTRLDHYNAYQNWVTKLFNAEFTFHYDLFLPGLQHLGFPLPLSGHSTHFRTTALEEIGAWDPYNVTEDCDVGIRLYRRGYRSDLLDSFSSEEATSSVHAWMLQRSRWVKGFIQTSMVHLRHPVRLWHELGGWRPFLAFLVIVPGSVLVNALNLFFWLLLIVWASTHSATIQQLFPGPVLYVSVASFVTGNFLFTYCNLLGAYRRQRFALVKYSLLSPLYWILLAVATVHGAVQMALRPHHWEKTRHGKHLTKTSYAITLPRQVAVH